MKKAILAAVLAAVFTVAAGLNTSTINLADLPSQHSYDGTSVADLPSQHSPSGVTVADLPSQHSPIGVTVADLPSQHGIG